MMLLVLELHASIDSIQVTILFLKSLLRHALAGDGLGTLIGLDEANPEGGRMKGL